MLRFKRIEYHEVDMLKDMTLRNADIAELRTSTGIENTWTSLKYAVLNSNEWTEICYDDKTGEVLAVFGLASWADMGLPWMVASPNLKKHRKLLMRYSKEVIQEMLNQFDTLNNYVDSRNVLHIRWLKHMGFSFTGKPLMIRGVPFLYFYKRREM